MTTDHQSPRSSSTHPWPKHLPLLLIFLITSLLLLLQIQSLRNTFNITSPSAWSSLFTPNSCSLDDRQRLRDSVTFLPLKDLRFSKTPMDGNTWFMSSFNDTRDPGESESLHFPSPASQSRLLCLLGRDASDGSKNHYALAWPDALPRGASVLRGLTFVCDTHYDYDNIWHAMGAVFPFVRWHTRNHCARPARWVLYHWGEVRASVAPWVRALLTAVFIDEPDVQVLADDDGPTCFEEAVVFRHNQGAMSLDAKRAVYDTMRCKARSYCNITRTQTDSVRLTLFLRTGARAFANELDRCAMKVRRPNGMSFCEQVRLMMETDVLVSSHGAQMTNMFFMERNSSVMEFFPRGWLELAGVGQYVFQWLAGGAGMRHEGGWWEPNREKCPETMKDDPAKCFNFYKNGKVGIDEAYVANWTSRVLKNARQYKLERSGESGLGGCECG
ncbi:hypothetical protein QJS10_CPA06g02159 [Acorus calamus]|uniref:Glycosyltransferase 61 catalytic domain-containing protein n=1 Tax=Acorus calamus TaxID=4465 RepID=A0AAV9ELN8_ACOCL|nr:hypothetical protein QJS10_CPA06g02159 [Acorus calamus]